MPIPEPNRFKDKDSFISKCMEVEVGSGKDREQSYAICNDVWRNRNMSTQQRVNQKIAGISLNPTKEEIMEAPCIKGYRQYGMKIKNGRKVPNCIPIEGAN